jgi:dimethylhistidine N-methyltransferase
MAANGVVRHYNFLPPGDTSAEEILAGLNRPQKQIAAKFFYDERGAALFESICALPEYYPTRVESALLHERAPEITQFLGHECELIEYGSGSGSKTRLLIERLRPRLYVPIDIACGQLRAFGARLSLSYPWLNVSALCADYSKPLRLPEWIGIHAQRRVAFFPGSTIGNFTPDEASAFLSRVRDNLGAGGLLLIGVDTKKSAEILFAAYNDSQGVTAEFNLNVLRRLNREYGANFDLGQFEHHAFYDESLGRIEMHLRSRVAQSVTVRNQRFEFAAGETILTELSYKYAVAEFHALARSAGFEPRHTWQDEQAQFSLYGLAVAR